MASRRQDHVIVGAAIAAIAMFVIAAILIAAFQRQRVVGPSRPALCGARCRVAGGATSLRAEGSRTGPRPIFNVRGSARHGASRKTLRAPTRARHTEARSRAQPASHAVSAAGPPQPTQAAVERPSAPPSSATPAGASARPVAVRRSSGMSGGDGSGGDGSGGDSSQGDHGRSGSGGEG